MTTRVWTSDPDGEYNEQSTIVQNRRLIIASDRTGRHWFLGLDDGERIDLNADNESDARAEALRIVQ